MAQQIAEKIEFSTRRSEFGAVIVTGRLELRCEMRLDGQYQHDQHAMDAVKERIRRELLASIFEDQRRELYEACKGLMIANPMNFEEQRAALERLLKAAKYQERKSA
jgi:hypothetical protein